MSDNHRQQRCTFDINDFVRYHRNQINKLFHIFVNEILSDQRRLFLLMQKIVVQKKIDSLLRHSLLKLSNERKIVDLFAVNAQKLYIIFIHVQNEQTRFDENDLLHVN